MERRCFVACALGAAAAWDLPRAWAQQPAAPIVGFLSSRSPTESAGVLASFRSGLAEAGFVEGRNVSIVFRWAEGRYEELRPLAAELVRLPVSVLLAAGGSPAALAAAGATSTIPVVFSGSPDPVGLRLVASLSRPGGNVTGMHREAECLGLAIARAEVRLDLSCDDQAEKHALDPCSRRALRKKIESFGG
jgi:putative ABC transport system substrate-binding protein